MHAVKLFERHSSQFCVSRKDKPKGMILDRDTAIGMKVLEETRALARNPKYCNLIFEVKDGYRLIEHLFEALLRSEHGYIMYSRLSTGMMYAVREEDVKAVVEDSDLFEIEEIDGVAYIMAPMLAESWRYLAAVAIKNANYRKSRSINARTKTLVFSESCDIPVVENIVAEITQDSDLKSVQTYANDVLDTEKEKKKEKDSPSLPPSILPLTLPLKKKIKKEKDPLSRAREENGSQAEIDNAAMVGDVRRLESGKRMIISNEPIQDEEAINDIFKYPNKIEEEIDWLGRNEEMAETIMGKFGLTEKDYFESLGDFKTWCKIIAHPGHRSRRDLRKHFVNFVYKAIENDAMRKLRKDLAIRSCQKKQPSRRAGCKPQQNSSAATHRIPTVGYANKLNEIKAEQVLTDNERRCHEEAWLDELGVSKQDWVNLACTFFLRGWGGENCDKVFMSKLMPELQRAGVSFAQYVAAVEDGKCGMWDVDAVQNFIIQNNF